MSEDTKVFFCVIGAVLVIFGAIGLCASYGQSLSDAKEIGPLEYAHLEGLVLSDPPLGIAVEEAFMSDGFINKREYQKIVARFGVESTSFRARLAAKHGIHKADADNNLLYPNVEVKDE